MPLDARCVGTRAVCEPAGERRHCMLIDLTLLGSSCFTSRSELSPAFKQRGQSVLVLSVSWHNHSTVKNNPGKQDDNSICRECSARVPLPSVLQFSMPQSLRTCGVILGTT
jgi:hypothetical protein